MAELMQPNIVGNFLNAYQSGLERQEAQKEAERQRMRQDRADQMSEQRFGMEMDEGELNMALRRGAAMNEILAGVDERNPQTLEIAKQRYLTTFGGKPEDVAQITMADIPRIKLQTGQTLKELELRLKQAQIGTEEEQRRAARALATQRYAAASGGGSASGAAAKAPSGYNYSPDGSRLIPIPGGPGDPARLQPGELSKIRNNNKQIDELENSLKAYTAALGKTTSRGRLLTRGAEVSSVETMHTDLLMQMKNLYELGVLNGPDYMLMTKIVEDPTGFMQVMRGTEGLNAQLGTVQSIINRARNLNNNRLEQAGVDAYRNPPVQGAATGRPTPAVASKTSGWSVNKVGN